jgi:hypothetical protein
MMTVVATWIGENPGSKEKGYKGAVTQIAVAASFRGDSSIAATEGGNPESGKSFSVSSRIAAATILSIVARSDCLKQAGVSRSELRRRALSELERQRPHNPDQNRL